MYTFLIILVLREVLLCHHLLLIERNYYICNGRWKNITIHDLFDNSNRTLLSFLKTDRTPSKCILIKQEKNCVFTIQKRCVFIYVSLQLSHCFYCVHLLQKKPTKNLIFSNESIKAVTQISVLIVRCSPKCETCLQYLCSQILFYDTRLHASILNRSGK